MKKRILIFSLAYEPLIGGAEIAVKELTERLAVGFSFDMVTLHFSHKHARTEKIGSVSVYRVAGDKFLFPFAAALRALFLHRENKYDAVWAIMANRAGAAALLFKIFHPRTPLVLTLQEGDPIPDIMRAVGIFRPLFKMLFRRADAVTAISNYLAEWGRKMGAKNVSVVPNGIDIFWFDKNQTSIPAGNKERFRVQKGFNKNDKIIITTSRLVHKNAVDTIIYSLKYLTNFHLLVLGDGPLRSYLESLANKLNLSKRVHFEGQKSNSGIIHFLNIADIFIRPSRSEGMGISFIEAMAAGLPVIATPVGGIPDFLRDKETGLFCKVNDPKSIAEAVLLLDEQPALREAIIASAFRMVREKYDWNTIAPQMREVFAKVCGV